MQWGRKLVKSAANLVKGIAKTIGVSLKSVGYGIAR